MDMHYVRSLSAQEAEKLAPRVGSPNRPSCEADLPQSDVLVRFPVAPLVRANPVPSTFEHPALLGEDDVFASRLLVRVMNQ